MKKKYKTVTCKIEKYVEKWGIYPKPKYIIENSGKLINSYNDLYNHFYISHPEFLDLKSITDTNTKNNYKLSEFAKIFIAKPMTLEQISKCHHDIYLIMFRYYNNREESLLNCFITEYLPNEFDYKKAYREKKVKAMLEELVKDNYVYLYRGIGTVHQQKLTRRLMFYFSKQQNRTYLNNRELAIAIENEFGYKVKSS